LSFSWTHYIFCQSSKACISFFPLYPKLHQEKLTEKSMFFQLLFFALLFLICIYGKCAVHIIKFFTNYQYFNLSTGKLWDLSMNKEIKILYTKQEHLRTSSKDVKQTFFLIVRNQSCGDYSWQDNAWIALMLCKNYRRKNLLKEYGVLQKDCNLYFF